MRCAQSGALLCDLDTEGQVYVAARGGAGGKGNAFFLSQSNRIPRVAERGAEGEQSLLTLELKLTAAAGLVGFPNAGKSTLLRAVSRARPKVASYPFTTLRPLLGVVEYEDMAQLAVADLPGLVRGAASHGTGLGADFLRHAERCRCLLLVVDAGANDDQYHPCDQVLTLREELEQYRSGLGRTPQLLIANKVDLGRAKDRLPELARLSQKLGLQFQPVSARYGTNIAELLAKLRLLYDEAMRVEQETAAREAGLAAQRDEQEDRTLFDEKRGAILNILEKL